MIEESLMAKASDPTRPEFTAVKLGRVSRQVVEQFQAQMRSRKLQPGDRLPPERELAEQFGVGRNSIREALRELDLLGVVESRHGEGTFVADPSAETLLAPFRAVIELSSTAAESVMEFRRVFEPGVAALAAQNATDEGRDLLHAALVAFEGRVDRQVPDVEIESADTDFHLTLGHATRNPTVIGVHTALYTLLRDFRSKLDRSSYAPSDRAVAGHRLIYEAITARDPEAASTAMRDHLDDVSSALGKCC
ncbi:FadR/GntR family transcriptional regulator [Mycobacterium sp. AMU20-3851]|uniref:FadR/GntR family transcriptional regulator n=1 Tax=Mycobacterium sp. AMU20-3851 TaxID=3122055 RepID=UPI003754061C